MSTNKLVPRACSTADNDVYMSLKIEKLTLGNSRLKVFSISKTEMIE